MRDLLRFVRPGRVRTGFAHLFAGVALAAGLGGAAGVTLPAQAGEYDEPFSPRPPFYLPEEGRGYGRLFPIRGANGDLKEPGVLEQSSRFNDLDALGRTMVEEGEPDHPAGDSELPAGYTYLGQFIDHDITWDTTTTLGRKIRSDGELENARTPDLDLDSVYGAGPVRSPQLYNLPYLRVGRRIGEDGLPRFDLLRTAGARRFGPGGGRPVAILGDPRNDENVVIAQLHAAFVAFHNRTVDILVARQSGARARFCEHEHCDTHGMAGRLPDNIKFQIFETARDHVIHYYHRVIMEDYLPRLIGERRVVDILRRGRDFYYPDGFRNRGGRPVEPTIPVEFAAAAFRFGHSQVRNYYTLSSGVRVNIFGDKDAGTGQRAFEPVSSRYVIDWRYFFDIAATPPQGFNYARRVDPMVTRALHRLGSAGAVGVEDVWSLPARNLVRGRTWHLPVGQDVAERVLPALHERGVLGQLGPGPRVQRGERGAPWQAYMLAPDKRTRHFLGEEGTPLWYYVLQEAAIFGTRTTLQSIPATAVRNGEDGDLFDDRERNVRLRPAGPWRPAALNDRDWVDDRQPRWRDGGHRLGPVGGTIVGEVLTGLLEHYREKTGKGLAYRPSIRGSISLFGPAAGGQPHERYMMRNLLVDAQVARPQ